MSVRRPARFPALALAALTLLAGALPTASAAKRAVLPEWTVGGEYDVDVDFGRVDLAGTFTFTFGGESGSMTLQYDDGFDLVGGGAFGFDFFSVTCTSTVDEFGVQHVRIADDPDTPAFAFDGTLQENGLDITGTASAAAGWGGLPAATEEEITLVRAQRTPVQDAFRLIFTALMDRKGRVRGAKDEDGKELRASLVVYPNRLLEGGLVRGKVTTNPTDGTTAAKIKIRTRGWSAVLTGTVDETDSGNPVLRALADVRGGGFVLDDVPVVLPVLPGPEPPPPPPPPPPKNLVKEGVARIAAGQVTITRQNLPSRYWTKFGRGADLTIEFPQTEVGTTMVANTASSSGAGAKRAFVTNGTKSWGAAGPGGSVTMTVNRRGDGSYVFSTAPGGTIEVLCQGMVADAAGRLKPLDVLIQATVVQ